MRMSNAILPSSERSILISTEKNRQQLVFFKDLRKVFLGDKKKDLFFRLFPLWEHQRVGRLAVGTERFGRFDQSFH